MAEKKRGGAENAHLHKSKKKMRLDLDDPVIDFFSEVASALSIKREEGDFKCVTAHSSSCLAPCRNEAAVKTAAGTLRENLKKEHQETIKCVASEIEAMRDASEFNYENERQKLLKELTLKSEEYVSSLIWECEKLRATFEKFREEFVTHVTAFEDIMSKFKAEKELLSMQDGQQSEKYRTAMSEVDRECLAKINVAKRDMFKEKPGQEGHRLLFNYLRSLVEDAADDAAEEQNNEDAADDAAGEEGAEDAAHEEVQKMPDS